MFPCNSANVFIVISAMSRILISSRCRRMNSSGQGHTVRNNILDLYLKSKISWNLNYIKVINVTGHAWDLKWLRRRTYIVSRIQVPSTCVDLRNWSAPVSLVKLIAGRGGGWSPTTVICDLVFSGTCKRCVWLVHISALGNCFSLRKRGVHADFKKA
jgi:hypothetical protein